MVKRKRHKKITVWLTEEEREAIKNKAKDNGLTIAEFLLISTGLEK